MKNREFWMPVIASLAATPVFLILGLGSAGAGHGDYVLARILFPYTILSALFIDSIVAPFIVLAVVQFPLYGLALGKAAQKGRLLKTLCFILVAHVAAALICFLPIGDNF